MKKKLKGKLKIILITCGALVVCAAALVAGIIIAGNIEENKIVKTAYADSGQTKQMDALVEDDTVAPALAADTEQLSGSGTQEAETGTDLNEQDGITVDDAKSSYQLMFKVFFGSEIPEKYINASLDSATNAWLLGNKEGIAYIDSETGEVIAFYNVRGYLGETIFSEDEFASYKEDLTKDHDKYIEKATSFIEKNFADGRNISEVLFDGVVFTGDPGKKGTFRLTVRVLMESGNSYCLVYTESPYNLERFFSYETRQDCLEGSSFENGPPAVYNNYVYTPEIVYHSEIGPEHLTVDEAFDLAIEYSEIMLGKAPEKSLLSANFRITATGTSRATWYVYNDYMSIGLDAITGNIISIDYYGTDDFEDKEKMPSVSSIESDDEYFTKAREIVSECLGNDGEVDYMMIDGIQVIYDAYNAPVSYLVDCHVIMKTGPCYTISFAGSDKTVRRIYSYESEEALFNP